MKNTVFKVEETTYLSTARFMEAFKKLVVMKCTPQDWSVTLASLIENKALHRYLRRSKRTKGIQIIFRYENNKNGKMVIILTTYDARTGTAKRVGSGWVMIIDRRNKKPFFWFQLRRTRYFLKRLLEVTELMIAIVDNWPTCPECGQDLLMVQVPNIMHMRAFTCHNSTFKHRKLKPYFLITTMVLPEKYLTMMRNRFDEFYMYRRAEAEQGNDRQYARIIRSRRNQDTDQAAVSEDWYGDLRYEPKNGETIYYDEAHPE